MTAQQVVSLQQARDFLRLSSAYTQDDQLLQDVLIPAATAVSEKELGDFLPHNREEWHDGGGYDIWLRNGPLLAVQLVEEGWGQQTFPLTYVQVNSPYGLDKAAGGLYAYSIDNLQPPRLSRRFAGNINAPFAVGKSNIHVVYTTGLAEIPAAVTLGALVLIQFWYEATQQRQTGTGGQGFNAVAEDFVRSTGATGSSYGVPWKVLEIWRGASSKVPVIG